MMAYRDPQTFNVTISSAAPVVAFQSTSFQRVLFQVFVDTCSRSKLDTPAGCARASLPLPCHVSVASAESTLSIGIPTLPLVFLQLKRRVQQSLRKRTQGRIPRTFRMPSSTGLNPTKLSRSCHAFSCDVVIWSGFRCAEV